MENVVVPRVRTNFNTMQFLKKAGLDAPIGGDMFLCGNASSGPSQLPKVCPVRTTTTGMPSGSSTNGYVSWSGVVVFTSSASVMTAFNGLILGACGLILCWIVRL